MDTAEAKRLYETYGFVVFRQCRNILGCDEEARDALQVVFTRLMERWETIRDRERVVPWIYRCAKNHCFNVLRARKRLVAPESMDTFADGEDFVERLGARQIIGLLLACHKPKVRDAVYYTYVEQMTQAEIQAVTGQSPATVRRNLAVFKRSLPGLRKRLLSV
jgi:RNA polymerase sigma-70 factor (ECF subfamily)